MDVIQIELSGWRSNQVTSLLSGGSFISAEITFVSRMIKVQSFLERRGLEDIAAQFRGIEFESGTLHQGCDLRAQTGCRRNLFAGRGAKNLADFFLHAAAIPPGAALQADFHAFFELTKLQFAPWLPLVRSDITISVWDRGMKEQYAFVFLSLQLCWPCPALACTNCCTGATTVRSISA